MTLSLRARITALATVVVALVLLLASLLFAELVERDLLAATERALAAELELALEEGDFDKETAFFELDIDDRTYQLGLFTEDDEGVGFGSLFSRGEPVADILVDVDSGRLLNVEVYGDGPAIGELAEELEDLAYDLRDVDGDDGNDLLVGATARSEVDESLQAVHAALWITVPVLVALLAWLIWLLVGRALRPVEAITAQVREISTQSLDQRVPIPGQRDEIHELANVMNSMLDRLESGNRRVQQFSADASHELRTPLSSVRAAAELIALDPKAERTTRLADDIVAESDRMEDLVSDLLALARHDEAPGLTSVTTFDVAELVRDVAESRELSTTSACDPDALIAAHQGDVRRAIVNLVDNAQHHARQKVHVSVLVDEAVAIVHVDDDGPGVPPESRTRVFDRFHRLDDARSRSGGGTGLGLALVRAIAEAHGGSIDVSDAPDLGGARFTLRLPKHRN